MKDSEDPVLKIIFCNCALAIHSLASISKHQNKDMYLFHDKADFDCQDHFKDIYFNENHNVEKKRNKPNNDLLFLIYR